jgi:predicted ester cyclase
MNTTAVTLTDTDGFTEKQRAFLDAWKMHGDTKQAILDAGYDCKTDNSLRVMAYQVQRIPHVKAAMDAYRADLRAHFNEECYAAFQTIVNLMNSNKVSARTRLDCAKDILDRAGYNPTTKVEGVGFDNRLAEVAGRARALAEGALDADFVQYAPLDAVPGHVVSTPLPTGESIDSQP